MPSKKIPAILGQEPGVVELLIAAQRSASLSEADLARYAELAKYALG